MGLAELARMTERDLRRCQLTSEQIVHTPDGRYMIVRGRLWRLANPSLSPTLRYALVYNLMAARRAVKDAKGDSTKRGAARAAVDIAKRALGERGVVWWTDGSPDYNRCLVHATPYASWFATIGPEK